jgi:hypothetical protein
MFGIAKFGPVATLSAHPHAARAIRTGLDL